MKSILRAAAMTAGLMICGMLSPAAAQGTQNPFNARVVVFGDGFSDTGNLDYRSSNPGGMLWIEQVLGAKADPNYNPAAAGSTPALPIKMKLLFKPNPGETPSTPSKDIWIAATNGAFAGNDSTYWSVKPFNATPYTPNAGYADLFVADGNTMSNHVVNQIDRFRQSGGTLSAGDVVFYWAGSINIQAKAFRSEEIEVNQGQNLQYFFIAGAQAGKEAAEQSLAAIKLVGNISGSPLNAKTIVVMSMPDLGDLPRFRERPYPSIMSKAVETYNVELDSGLKKIAAANSNTKYVFIDISKTIGDLIAKVRAQPGSDGFFHADTPCNISDADCDALTYVDASKYLFYDDIHPTDAGHKLIADTVKTKLGKAGVQVPSGN